MSKTLFQSDLPASLTKEMEKSISKSLKTKKTRLRKQQEKEMLFDSKRLSPINYLVLKVLHGQFGEHSHAAVPIAIGMIRKSLSQVKRILSHGSL